MKNIGSLMQELGLKMDAQSAGLYGSDAWKALPASSYQKECSRATPRSIVRAAAALHEVGKWTCPSLEGDRPACSCSA